jgi:hypothetical protein
MMLLLLSFMTGLLSMGHFLGHVEHTKISKTWLIPAKGFIKIASIWSYCQWQRLLTAVNEVTLFLFSDASFSLVGWSLGQHRNVKCRMA